MRLCVYCGNQIENREVKCSLCGGENEIAEEKKPKFTIEEKNIFESDDESFSNIELNKHNGEVTNKVDAEIKGSDYDIQAKEQIDENIELEKHPTCVYCGNILKTDSKICEFCQEQPLKETLDNNPTNQSSAKVNFDYEKAEELYQQADKFFNAKEYEKAIELYQESFELGNDFSGYSIGHIYSFYLEENETNQRKAFEWYLAAAKRGETASKYYLALCYEEGTGITQNYKQAIYWYEDSASENEESSLALGIRYRDGLLGLEVDYEKAIEYFKLSIDTVEREDKELNSEKYHECALCYEYMYKELEEYEYLINAIEYYELAVGNGYEADRGIIQDLNNELKRLKENGDLPRYMYTDKNSGYQKPPSIDDFFKKKKKRNIIGVIKDVIENIFEIFMYLGILLGFGSFIRLIIYIFYIFKKINV